MSRSFWKGPCIDYSFCYNTKTNVFRKVMNRGAFISTNCLNKRILIHNGLKYIPIRITSEKVGSKIGEFSFTRARRVKGKDNKQRNSAKKKK